VSYNVSLLTWLIATDSLAFLRDHGTIAFRRGLTTNTATMKTATSNKKPNVIPSPMATLLLEHLSTINNNPSPVEERCSSCSTHSSAMTCTVPLIQGDEITLSTVLDDVPTPDTSIENELFGSISKHPVTERSVLSSSTTSITSPSLVKSPSKIVGVVIITVASEGTKTSRSTEHAALETRAIHALKDTIK